MTDMREIYEKDPELREVWHQIIDLKEEMLWVGCNPSNPELYKEQVEEGFRLMRESGKLYVKMAKILEKY